jgi:hypothetical protein
MKSRQFGSPTTPRVQSASTGGASKTVAEFPTVGPVMGKSRNAPRRFDGDEDDDRITGPNPSCSESPRPCYRHKCNDSFAALCLVRLSMPAEKSVKQRVDFKKQQSFLFNHTFRGIRLAPAVCRIPLVPFYLTRVVINGPDHGHEVTDRSA